MERKQKVLPSFPQKPIQKQIPKIKDSPELLQNLSSTKSGLEVIRNEVIIKTPNLASLLKSGDG
jgi:hypothetical protein